ncbi:MAG: sigma-70 family RNA polymerase sigma factor [Clostridiales bacterium]|nr:sigma-70 family RNA polymerase sigma factor [Clostridiales bacterium]
MYIPEENITKEEIQTLVREAKGGSQDAKTRVCQACYGVVLNCIKEGLYIKNYSDMDDFIQEGMLGVLAAIDNFDPDAGLNFYNYSAFWIKKYLSEFNRNNRLIIFPDKLFRSMNKVAQKFSEYKAQYGKYPDSETLSKELSMPLTKVEKVQNCLGRYVNFTRDIINPLKSDNYDEDYIFYTLGQNLFDGDWEDQIVEQAYEEELYHRLVQQLPKAKYRDIINYVLLEGKYSAAEISRELSISHSRVKVLKKEMSRPVKKIMLDINPDMHPQSFQTETFDIKIPASWISGLACLAGECSSYLKKYHSGDMVIHALDRTYNFSGGKFDNMEKTPGHIRAGKQQRLFLTIPAAWFARLEEMCIYYSQKSGENVSVRDLVLFAVDEQYHFSEHIPADGDGTALDICMGGDSMSLQEAYPEIAMEWHPDKNGTLTPDQVSCEINKAVWWYKPYDDPVTGKHFDFEWKSNIQYRIKKRAGCPYLSNHPSTWTGFNDLETRYPEIAAEWHPVKNGSLKPCQVLYRTKRKVWWLLPYDDPDTGEHYEFEWEETVENRTQKNRGCPYLGHA